MSAVNSPNNDGQGINVGIPVNTPGSGLSPQGVAVNLNINNRNNSNTSSNGNAVNMPNGSPQMVQTGLQQNVANNPGMGRPMMNNLRLTQAQLQILQQQQQMKLQQQQQQQNIPGNPLNNPNLTPQQKQKLMLQQRALQQQRQQQAMHNFENQFYQLLMTINKKPKRLYNFVEDTDSILKKYEQYRPSFEFHIYENNYKICAPANTRVQQQQKSPEISNDGLVLNKNNEILKDFLEYVARGIMPEALMEVLRDCNLQLYEGNIVLQVYDHTNTVDIIPKDQPKQTKSETSGSIPPSVISTGVTTTTAAGSTTGESITSPVDQTKSPEPNTTQGSTPTVKKEEIAHPNVTSPGSRPNLVKTSFRRPRVYRTLLRPTDLSSYYDMMTYADQARFSDTIYNQLEAELLTLTKRNIDLNVKLNPYEHQAKIGNDDFSIPEWDETTQKMKFEHREISKDENTKGAVGHIAQHEELPQHNSTYEQMMLIMSERTSTTTNSAFAAALAKHATDLKSSKSGSGNSSNSKGASGNGRGGNNSTNGVGGSSNADTKSSIAVANAAAAASNMTNENNQFSRLKFIEQYRINKEKRKQQQALNAVKGNGNLNASALPFNMKISMTTGGADPSKTPQKQKGQTGKKAAGAQGKGTKRASNTDKPKVKRPRKPKKTPANGETPKKKRVTKKKAAATAAASTPTASTPAENKIDSTAATPVSTKSQGSPPAQTPK